MQNRLAIVSFSGPWGYESSNIHVRSQIKFPVKYPLSAALKVQLERTTMMSQETCARISAEVWKIAEAYLAHQKSSLEACLRYLLGEQTLGESLIWLHKRRESNDLDTAPDANLSSSDDDDDELGRSISRQPRGMDMSDGAIAVSNAQYNVPLPKACGALWADNGRLVCFFPPKEEKTHSLLDSLSLRTSERTPKGRKAVFQRFGRLHDGSRIHKAQTSTLETGTDGDSDSEESSTSSSGSSISSEGNGLLRNDFLPSMPWRRSLVETYKVHSLDDSHKSSGGPGLAQSVISKSSNYISIHDCCSILPSKQYLARGYSIITEGPDCCEANAQVAETSGDSDLASIWLLIALLLKDEVPLEAMQHPYHNDGPESILVVTRRLAPSLRSKDSAIDLSFDTTEESLQMNTRGTTKWGYHPFGRRGLIKSL